MSDLLSELDKLSPAEKIELLDALWVSLETEVPPPTDAQRSELDRRIALYEQDRSDVVPWEQVKARLFTKE